MRWTLPLVVAGLAVALAGCMSTAERSAQIEREGNHLIADQGNLQLRPTKDVRVRRAVLVRGDGAAAAAVQIQNVGRRALVNVPVEIAVRGRHGALVYDNKAIGIQPALQRIALLRPGQTIWWVNDQVLSGPGTAKTVKARVGASPAVARPPRVTTTSVHWSSDASGPYLVGGLVNPGATTLLNVPIWAVARRGSRIIAAGRALVPRLPAGAGVTGKPVQFRLVFIGAPAQHAPIDLTVAPTSETGKGAAA